MTESNVVREMLSDSLADIEPPTFRDHLEKILAGEPLTPGVLTLRTARALDPSVDSATGAMRGAGVQLSYEGLRLTRSIIRERGVSVVSPSKENGATPDSSDGYYLDLLAAEVLVSRGFYHLATTGVSDQAVDIVRRFGRNQTAEIDAGTPSDPSLEVDVIKLAVNAGADLANVPTTPAVTTLGETLAAELEGEPLPSPDEALTGIENRILTAANASEVTEVDRR